MRAKLSVVGGDEAARQFELRLPAIIGRSRTTDVRLGHPLISRQHCEVFEDEGRLMLRDLGSLNGTFVGDTRLSNEPIALASGEQFSVGPVKLQAEYQSSSDNSSPSAWQAGGPTVDSPLSDIRMDAAHRRPRSSRMAHERPIDDSE